MHSTNFRASRPAENGPNACPGASAACRVVAKWGCDSSTSTHTNQAGPHDSILGRRADRVLETVRTFRPTHFEVAKNDVRLHGTIVDVDPETGRATAIQRLAVDQPTASRLASLARRHERCQEPFCP